MKKNWFFNIAAITILITLLPACWGEGQCTDCAGHDHGHVQEVAQAKKGLVIVNVLDKDYYDDCHIKGSINVPFEQADKFIAELETLYGAEKESLDVVIYCSNYMCSASGEVTKKLLSKGFVNAKAYEAGMAEWYQYNLPVEGSCKKPYLNKKMPAPAHEANSAIITTQELAQKLGVEISAQPEAPRSTDATHEEVAK